MALSSIFNNNNNKSSILRRGTFSSAPTADAPAMSKVKRFGSMLIRNKKTSESRQRVDTVFPNPIDTSLASSYSLSTASTTTHSSDEDDLVTPTTPNKPPVKEMTFESEESFVVCMVTPTVSDETVTPEVITNQVQEVHVVDDDNNEEEASHQEEVMETTSVILDASDEIIMTESSHIVEQDPSMLSGVSLVRYHLNMALEEADEEIEQELETCRLQMLHSLHTVPLYAY